MYKNRPLLIKKEAKTFGFYQSSNPDYPILSPSLTTPTQSRYVNDVHGLITQENIDQSRANFMMFPHDAWDVATTYEKGDLVIEANVSYEYVNNTPSAANLVTDTDFWFKLDDINEYLIQKRFQAVARVIDTVFNGKKIRTKVKSIYDNIALFDGVANYKNLETNQDKFVGLRFRMKTDRSLVTTIKKIGTQFNEVVNPLPLYLYHSSQQLPIAPFTINHAKANSSVWTTLTTGNELRYLDDSYDAGGEFFLGYAQSDLGTAKALRMTDIDWINGNGCKSCPGNRSFRWFQNYSAFIDVIGFSIAESAFTVGSTIFNPADVAISPDRNYGLNINMSNECDLTPFFMEHDYLLSEAMNNVAGLEILKDMATNVRGANGLANQVAQEANKQLFQVEGVFGTVKDITEASLKGLSFDLSGLQDECLACDDSKAEVINSTVTLR
jgi:hypothetical protein